MKCKGIKDPSKCLSCKYPDCIADELGNLPPEVVEKILKNRQQCKEYYQRHKEELKAKRQTPEARERKYKNTLAWRKNNPEKTKKQLRDYYKRHREELRQKQHDAYMRNREERCAQMREYYWRRKCASMSESTAV